MQLAALLGSIYAEVAAVQRKDRFNTVSIRKMHERHVGQLKMLIDIAFHNLCHRARISFTQNRNSEKAFRSGSNQSLNKVGTLSQQVGGFSQNGPSCE